MSFTNWKRSLQGLVVAVGLLGAALGVASAQDLVPAELVSTGQSAPMLLSGSRSEPPAIGFSNDKQLIEELTKRLDKLERDREAEAKKREEEEQKKQQEEQKQSEEEDKKAADEASLFAKVLENLDSAKGLQLSGRMQWDYAAFPTASRGIGFFEHPDPDNPLFGTDPSDRYYARRLRLTFRGEVLDNFVYKLDLEFANGRAEFRDAYLGVLHIPLFTEGIYVGNQKRPYGYDFWNSSNHNPFTERPDVVDAFTDSGRRLGICGYGCTASEALNWQIGVFLLQNLQGNPFPGQAYFGDTPQASFNTRISTTPFYDEATGASWLHLGWANVFADPDGFADSQDAYSNAARFRSRPEERSDTRWVDTGSIPGAQFYNIAALECVLNLGPFNFTTEAQNNYVWRENRGNTNFRDVNFLGYYVQMTYFLTGENFVFDRKVGKLGQVVPYENFFLVERCTGGLGGGWGAWMVGLRYSWLDLSDQDILGGRQEILTGVVDWWWNEHSRLIAEYHIGDIQDRSPVDGYTAGSWTGVNVRFDMHW